MQVLKLPVISGSHALDKIDLRQKVHISKDDAKRIRQERRKTHILTCEAFDLCLQGGNNSVSLVQALRKNRSGHVHEN